LGAKYSFVKTTLIVSLVIEIEATFDPSVVTGIAVVSNTPEDTLALIVVNEPELPPPPPGGP